MATASPDSGVHVTQQPTVPASQPATPQPETCFGCMKPWLLSAFLALVFSVTATAYVAEQSDLRQAGFGNEDFPQDELILRRSNQGIATAALQLFTLSLLCGRVAVLYHAVKGGEARLPAWLLFWLQSRKAMGSVSLICATIHAIISAMIWPGWFSFTLDRTRMTNRPHREYQVAILFGTFAYCMLLGLAALSLPGQFAALGAAIYRRTFKWLGWATLLVASFHPFIWGQQDRSWRESQYDHDLPPLTLLACLLPLLTMFLLVASEVVHKFSPHSAPPPPPPRSAHGTPAALGSFPHPKPNQPDPTPV